MGLYERYCLPHLINLACGTAEIRRQREQVISLATGRVLEVGMGSGLNLPFYDQQRVEVIWGLEPAAGMRAKAAKNIEQSELDVRVLDAPGESVPLGDQSVDTVVLVYTLCTIPDGLAALREMRRVLKPGGKLIFCEHGEAPDESVRRWQNRINPLWKRVAGGCHLNRAIPRLIAAGGFEVESLETDYLSGPKFATYNYWGTAFKSEWS